MTYRTTELISERAKHDMGRILAQLGDDVETVRRALGAGSPVLAQRFVGQLGAMDLDDLSAHEKRVVGQLMAYLTATKGEYAADRRIAAIQAAQGKAGTSKTIRLILPAEVWAQVEAMTAEQRGRALLAGLDHLCGPDECGAASGRCGLCCSIPGASPPGGGHQPARGCQHHLAADLG